MRAGFSSAISCFARLLRPFPTPRDQILYCVLAALAVYGVTILLSNATLRLTIIVSLLALAIVHVLIGIVQFTRGDNFMLDSVPAARELWCSSERISCLSQSSCRIVGGIGSFWIEHRVLEPLAALVEIARGLCRRRLLRRRSDDGEPGWIFERGSESDRFCDSRFVCSRSRGKKSRAEIWNSWARCADRCAHCDCMVIS